MGKFLEITLSEVFTYTHSKVAQTPVKLNV